MTEKNVNSKQDKIDALMKKYEKIIEDMGGYQGDGKILDGGRTRFTPIGEDFIKEYNEIMESEDE